MTKRAVTINVNGAEHPVQVEPHDRLIDVLRDQLGLKSVKEGCSTGDCGICAVMVDGRLVNSCLMLAAQCDGRRVTTLEGLPALYARQRNLASPPALHPLQRAMIEEQAPQCGYCYNGMIIKGAELLSQKPQPSEREVREAMNGHLCRCGSYPRIMKAIVLASRIMAEERQ